MVLDRHLVAKSLMGTVKIVFNEPLGESSVEDFAVGRHVAHLDEFFLKSPVEPLIKGIVSRSFGAGEVMRQREVLVRLGRRLFSSSDSKRKGS